MSLDKVVNQLNPFSVKCLRLFSPPRPPPPLPPGRREGGGGARREITFQTKMVSA